MNKEKLTEWVELIIAALAKIPMPAILILFSIIGLGAGIFMVINPNLAIEMQRRFYEKINWKIEPISMSREIRNTRIMGIFLIIFTIVAILFVLAYNKLFF